MATIGNYGAALGDALKQTAGGIVKGFGYGLKGAMLSEMPGLVAGYGAFSSLRKDANSMGQAQQAAVQTPTRSQTKPSATGNPFAQMVQQLAQINSNTAMSASVAKASAQAEQYKMMFEEEKAREQAQQNQALIDAIKNSGMGGNGTGGANVAAEPPKENFLTSFLGGVAGAVGKMLLDGLMKGLSKLRVIIVAAFTAAMPFLRKMLVKVLSFALKRALFLIPGVGLLLGGAALAYDLADMGGAFDGGDDGDSAQGAGKGAGKKGSGVTAQPTPTGKPPRYKTPQEFDQEIARFSKTSNPNLPPNARYIATLQAEKAALVGGATSSPSSAQGTSPSPVGTPTTTGANKTTGVKWRVPLRNSYTVTSEHEEKRGPPKYKTNYTHKGVDLALYQGAPIVAAADGMITVNSSDPRSGNFVMMDHGSGYTTLYAHLLMSNSMPGTKVTAGTVIGYNGTSGHSSGPHLHFEIRLNGVSKNPRDFIQLGKKAQLTKVDREAEIPKPGLADSGESANPKKSPGPKSRRDTSKFNVPGYAAQVNKKLTDTSVTTYYKALSEGKTEAEAKKLALEVASTNPVAKKAVEVASEKFKAEVDKDSAIKPKSVDVVPASSSAVTPLIEMGDGAAAEAAAARPTSNAVVNARNKAVADKFLTERKAEENKKEVVKFLRQTSENTLTTAKELKSNRITMSKGKFTRPEDILARANKQFTDSLQRQLTKTISGTLMSALYPGGYKNVSQRTASGQMYRGEQLNKMLGVTPALTKLGTSIFGKQYGPAFGQIFSKVGTAYMEVGARSVAQGIFGSAFKGAGMADGVAEQQANILGGQILGNLAKGTKQGRLTALEQILYGASGGTVALGPETIFAKYGFASPQDGIGYMANVLGSSLMSPINSGLGTTPLNMRNMDPRMRTMGAFGGYGGEYGGMPTGMSSAGTLQAAAQNNPYMQVTKEGMVVIADNMPQQTKDIAETLNATKKANEDAWKQFDEAGTDADARAVAQKLVSETQLQEQMLTNRLLSQRGPGGGTSIRGGGGGGFFTGDGVQGSFSSTLAEVGNMGLDLGKSAITQKVVQSMGITNPYMSLLASFAVNKGVSYLGGKAFDLFKGTEMGQSVVGYGNTLTNAYRSVAPTWAGGYDAATLADLQMGQAMTANAGVEAAAGASPVLTGFETVAPYLPYIPAFVALAKGDIGAAAGYAVGAYAGTAIGASLAEAGFAFGGPIGAVAGFVIGSLLGGLFGGGGSSYVPVPTIWRIIRVSGNNNINAIVDLQAPFDNPPKEFFELCDALLRVGFNTTKAAEVATKKPPPFDFLMCTMNNRDGVYFSLRKGDPTSADIKSIHLGKADKAFSAGKSASEIVKLITTAFKEEYAADATALDDASKLLNKKTFKELSSGLAREFKTGKDKLDTSIDRGVFGGTAAEDAIIVAGRANAPRAGVAGDEYSAETPPQIYSMKEGKYIDAPYTNESVMVDGEYGPTYSERKVYDTSILMYDKDGNPIYDKNNSGGIDLADIVKPTLTTTSGTITGGTNSNTTTGATGTTGNVNVVTNADNSQRNNQSVNTYYASTLSKTKNPIKDAMLQTGLPA
jgi:murein DD-endopeptidase MepM/ murein hydrolase activator NlpD